MVNADILVQSALFGPALPKPARDPYRPYWGLMLPVGPLMAPDTWRGMGVSKQLIAQGLRPLFWVLLDIGPT